MKITVTDDRGREASYELPDEVGRKFAEKWAWNRATYERWLTSEFNENRLSGAVRLAVLDVFEAKPVQVGHLATTPSGNEVEVRHIDGDVTFHRWHDGLPGWMRTDNLTYSRPKPEGWGQQ